MAASARSPATGNHTSVCSTISRASSTSIPRYRTVLSSLLTAVNSIETTALYAQVATDILREVISPLEGLNRE